MKRLWGVIAIGNDGEWRKVGETEGYGTGEAATTGYAYNAAGEMTTVTDARGKLWRYTYDVRSRVATFKNPLNHLTSWTYDAVGNRLTETRADGGVTANTYDAMNRLLTTTDPKGQTTAFAYDAEGNLAALTDAQNKSYGFAYDVLSRKTGMSYPGGSSEGWTYDAVGNVLTYTTRAGQVRACSYDARNRELTCDWSDGTPDVVKTYDNAGRLQLRLRVPWTFQSESFSVFRPPPRRKLRSSRTAYFLWLKSDIPR